MVNCTKAWYKSGIGQTGRLRSKMFLTSALFPISISTSAYCLQYFPAVGNCVRKASYTFLLSINSCGLGWERAALSTSDTMVLHASTSKASASVRARSAVSRSRNPGGCCSIQLQSKLPVASILFSRLDPFDTQYIPKIKLRRLSDITIRNKTVPLS
jgi:hypothetical protein